MAADEFAGNGAEMQGSMVEAMARGAYEQARRAYATASPPWESAAPKARQAIIVEQTAALQAIYDAGISETVLNAGARAFRMAGIDADADDAELCLRFMIRAALDEADAALRKAGGNDHA